jgi:3-oxoacyl-[acyl-carrier protein] reductase
MASLKDQVVLITGASRGIGLAAAEAFFAQGARLAVCARDASRLGAAESALRGRGEVFARAVDVRDADQVRDFVRGVEACFGRIDVLVNNAGVLSHGPFAAEDYAAMDAEIDVNVKGVLFVTRAVLPGMLAREDGAIINVASGAGLTGFAELASYCASKFAVVGFTESLDQEVRGRGVYVCAVCPGRVATDMQLQYAGRKIGIPPSQVAERIVTLALDRPGSKRGKCVAVS